MPITGKPGPAGGLAISVRQHSAYQRKTLLERLRHRIAVVPAVRFTRPGARGMPDKAISSRCRTKVQGLDATKSGRRASLSADGYSSPVPVAANRSAASSMNALTKGETCRLLGYTA